jgi:hypothetical protein
VSAFEDASEQLAWVRYLLARLAESRLLEPLSPDDEFRYQSLCGLEQQLLAGR